VEKSSDPSVDFETSQLPKDWPNKIIGLSPTIYIEGHLEDLSEEDSKSVAKSLMSLQKKQPKTAEYVDVLNTYDTTNGTTAILRKYGWGDPLRHIFSTNLSAGEIHDGIDKCAKLWGISEYQVIPVEKGVKIDAKDGPVLDVLSQFSLDSGAKIKDLRMGQGNEGQLEVGIDDAKALVFPTELRKITHADVNCFTTGNGNMINQFLNIKKGAVYASNEKMEVKTQTPEKMKEILQKLF
jgi:hypothetical protein